MKKVTNIITYAGLILMLAAVGVIIYINVRDRQEQAARAKTTPQRASATSTKAYSLPPMGEPLISALDAISSERMFATLDALISIQPHSGWRGGGTQGEKEAFDYIESQLSTLDWLTNTGMEIEREKFNVFLATEDHTTSIFFNAGNQTEEIPADTMRGSRDDPILAFNLDTDDGLNDSSPDPIKVEGETILVPDEPTLTSLTEADVKNKILLVSFSLLDSTNVVSESNARKIIKMDPAAVVLITQNSNAMGESHGSFAGDSGGMLQRMPWKKGTPLLVIELENLEGMGITDWEGLASVTQAKVEMDVDVVNPGQSGNLIVHIPGKNSEKPILVSAHIDSPNSPGALDDGSGSAILLEIAAVLNEQQIQPENDLYLAWYGSEELGIYGSLYFTTTHSDLMGKLQANVQIDCLSRPLDGLPAKITLMFSHISPSGLYNDPLAKYMTSRGSDLGLNLGMYYWPFASDNGSLSAFNVPNLNMIYESDQMNNYSGGVWVAGHFHDPYDTVNLAREMEDTYMNMAKMAMSLALIPSDETTFVDHSASKKVVFLANHTESPHMTPAGYPDFSLALIDAGYQISVIPYGRTLSTDDLSGVDQVVVLPVYDYALEDSGYDTAWTKSEVEIVDAYAQNGGRVLVINSANRLKLYNRVLEKNEDWSDLNILTSQWGVEFNGLGSDNDPLNVEDSGLLNGVSSINIIPENAVSFSIEKGNALAGVPADAYLAKIDVGKGQVVILGDLSVFGEDDQGLINPMLVHNIAAWE